MAASLRVCRTAVAKSGTEQASNADARRNGVRRESISAVSFQLARRWSSGNGPRSRRQTGAFYYCTAAAVRFCGALAPVATDHVGRPVVGRRILPGGEHRALRHGQCLDRAFSVPDRGRTSRQIRPPRCRRSARASPRRSERRHTRTLRPVSRSRRRARRTSTRRRPFRSRSPTERPADSAPKDREPRAPPNARRSPAKRSSRRGDSDSSRENIGARGLRTPCVAMCTITGFAKASRTACSVAPEPRYGSAPLASPAMASASPFVPGNSPGNGANTAATSFASLLGGAE